MQYPDKQIMPLIDSHAHLDFYKDTPDALTNILTRAREAGVETILAIGIGDGPATMHQALAIANQYIADQHIANQHPNVYASVGIHPQEAAHATPEALARLTALAADPRCIAIGEIGLDYYHADNPLPPIQKQAFIAQMKIAATLRKPILIHCRTSELASPAAKAIFEQHGNPAGTPARSQDAAWDDLLALINEHWTPHNLGGIMHCFSGTPAQAAHSLSAGFYLSFAGNLTYPKSTAIREAATQAPADRILVETDAPFLAPIPHRGHQNEPALVVHTAEALATLRNLTPQALADLTTANFKRLFPSVA